MICVWRGKQFSCSELTEIVVNDLRCASEVAYPFSHIAGKTVETNNDKTNTVSESVHISFCPIIQSRSGMPYASSTLVLSNFFGQAVASKMRKPLRLVPSREVEEVIAKFPRESTSLKSIF